MTRYSVSIILLISLLLPMTALATDPPPNQVQIETKFVQVRNDFERELGFEWGIGPVISHMTGDQSDGNVVGMTAFGGVDALLHPLISVFGHLNFTQFGDKTKFPDGYYKYKIGSFGADAGIKLHVTPTPSRPFDPYITLGIDVAVNAFGNQKSKFGDEKDREFFSLTDGDNRAFSGILAGVGITIRTDVVDISGQILVIGGLTQLNKNNVDRSVPFLAEIPLIFRFFGRDEQKDREELLILIKPEIIEDVQ